MKKSKIYQFYYILASLDIITIVATLSLAYGIHVVYENTFAENEIWISRINSYEKATNLIISANGPGNKVFETLDVSKEKIEFEKTFSLLTDQLIVIENDLKDESLKGKTLLNNHLAKIKQSLDKGYKSTYKIFEYIQKDNVTKAAGYMSQMDEHFHYALVKTSFMRAEIGKLQKSALDNNHKKATALFKKELLVGLLVFAIVGLVLFYGRKLKKEIESSEDELLFRQKELANLEHAIDEHSIVAKTDANGKIIFVNDKFCEISKYSREELIGKDHRIVNSGYHPRSFFINMWSEIKKGNTWREIVKNQAKDGTFYWVDTTITPIKDKKGKIVEFIAIRYDVTAQNQLSALTNNIQKIAKIGGWELDVNTFEVKWTDEVYRIHGLKIDSPISVADGINFYAPEYRDKITNYVEKCISDGISYDDEFKFINAQNKRLWVRAIGEAVRNKNGEVIKLRGTFQDITEIKHAEEQFEEQRKIALHTSKLASIGELAAGVGHEINNPLAILKGYITAIGKRLDKNEMNKESLSDYVNKSNVAISRIAKIVNGLRSFSRVDGDDFTLFDLKEAIEESYSLVREIYHNEGIEINLNIPNDIENLPMNGNRGKIQQIITNIIANAKDATKDKKNRYIDITVSRKSDFYELKIEDNGKGMNKEVKNKIFDPFFTTKALNEGTGIGLSLVHSMILEHNGMINVESVEGKGTVFIISLPKYISKKVSIPKDKKEEIVINYERDNFPGIRILVVDDEPAVREIMTDLLEDYDMEVSCAQDGMEAFERYKNSPESFDIILSDIQMPNLSGTEFLTKLRNNKNMKQPYFIFLTGGVNLNLDEFANLYDEILYKPIDEDKLKSILSKISKEINSNSKKAV